MSLVVMFIWNLLKKSPHEQTITWITEYPECERIHKDHQSPIPSPAQDSPINSPVPGSIVQTLLELWQAKCCDEFPGELKLKTCLH